MLFTKVESPEEKKDGLGCTSQNDSCKGRVETVYRPRPAR